MEDSLPRTRSAPPPEPAAAPTSEAGRRRGVEPWLFALLLVLHLLPLWVFPYFPSQDGPSHQGVTAILRQLDQVGGEAPSPELLRVFARNHEALPNLFTFWLLERVFGFASVAGAEKVLLTLYVLLLPLAFRFAVVSVDRRAAHLSWLGFPFVYNYLLHMGFYNFCFSLVAFLFTLGAFWRWRGRPTEVRTAALTLLVTWVYACHPVTLVVAIATLLVIALWDLALDLRAGRVDRSGLLAAAGRRLGPPLIASLPGVVLTALFVTKRTGGLVAGMTFAARGKHLLGLYSLASLDRRTAWLAAGTALFLFTLTVLALAARRRGLRSEDGLLAAAAVLVAVYFLAPNQMVGGGFIVHRLNLFPFLVLIPALAACEPPRRLRRAVPFLSALLACGFLFLLSRTYLRLDDGLAEIEAAGRAVPAGRTLLFLSYRHQGEDGAGAPLAFRTQPFVHAGSAVAAARRAVDLSLYEANEDHFPVIYRTARNPFTHLSTRYLGLEAEPPRVDLEAYPRRTGIPIDYVLLWGWRDEERGRPEVERVAGQLARGFDELERSPSGRVRLYRARALRE